MDVRSNAATANNGSARLPVPGVRPWRTIRAHRAPILASASIVISVSAAALAVAPGIILLLLVTSVTGVVWLDARTTKLERELRLARVRALTGVAAERRRVQRDLHDGAQQRLVAVRIHLGLLAQTIELPRDRAAVEQLGADVELALADMRSVTREVSPAILLSNGVADAVRMVAARAPLQVRVEADGFGRYEPHVERGLYFICVEALQNVLKHAGPGASARIRLTGNRRTIRFAVEDSGVGFDLARVRPGLGLVGLSDRASVLGGWLTIDTHPGMGTLVSGEIPADGAGSEVFA